MSRYGLDAQFQIYAKADAEAHLPLTSEDWRLRAQAALEAGPWSYLEGAAGAEDTRDENRRAFLRWRIRPRFLRNVDDRDLSVSLLGMRWDTPFILAPIGVQAILHPEAERASARAAARLGLPFTLSTVSSVSIEAVADEMGAALRWFQLYPGRDMNVTRSMVERAEQAGYHALIVTVDTTMLGWREWDLKNAYLPFLQGEGIANFVSDPAFCARLKRSPEADPMAAIQEFLSIYVNPAFTWTDLEILRQFTTLPLLVKGLSHPLDVEQAFRSGADGVVISNHGGRQVDGAIASLDALDDVMQKVGGNRPILVDSGVRHAADVFKALALGAKAVLIGRPYAYGLTVAGQVGVERVLGHLRAELDLQMALAGCRSLLDINRFMVERNPGAS